MTTDGAARRVLRTRPWLVVVNVVANALFLAGAMSSYPDSGSSWRFVAFVALAAFGALGLVQLAVARIVLEGDSLESHDLFFRRRYSASEIRGVKWERGVGVSVELIHGGCAKLPVLGYNSQGLTNTLRAWLKRSRRDEE